MDALPITPRSKVKRVNKRGHYDRQTIYRILDTWPLCSVAYVIEGKPYLTPTLQWRQGNHVYWHGSSASRFLRQASGQQVSLNVAILDGFVMARSAFHHSTNYRSVTLFGEAEILTDNHAKEQAMKAMFDQFWPGRWDALRPVHAQELKATSVLRMDIAEGAAKIRVGMPVDDDEDYELPIWAGVIPMRYGLEAPQNDPQNIAGVATPQHIMDYRLKL